MKKKPDNLEDDNNENNQTPAENVNLRWDNTLKENKMPEKIKDYVLCAA